MKDNRESLPPPASAHGQSTIGSRLRRIRRELNLSLKILAETADVSVGMISQIERDQANPSIRVLEKLRVALRIPLSALLEDSPAPRTPVAGESRDFVRRSEQRPHFTVGPKGLSKELLSPSGEHDLQFMIILLPAHTRSEEVLVGQGEKAGMVLEGRIALTVDHQEEILNVGDSFQFSSALPHGVVNPGDHPARILWIMNTQRPVIHF